MPLLPFADLLVDAGNSLHKFIHLVSLLQLTHLVVVYQLFHLVHEQEFGPLEKMARVGLVGTEQGALTVGHLERQIVRERRVWGLCWDWHS